MENMLLSFALGWGFVCGAGTAVWVYNKLKYLPAYRRGYRAALETVRSRFRGPRFGDGYRMVAELIEARSLNKQADAKLREAKRLVAQLPPLLQDLS